MPGRFSKDSLSRRVIVALIAGEIVLAVVLAATVGIFSALSISRQRFDALHEEASVLASAMRPALVDQREGYVQAQLSSILRTAGASSIRSVRVVDTAGVTVASTGDAESSGSLTAESPRGSLSSLWRATVIEEPVQVNGVTVAMAFVQFAPLGLWEWLRDPLISGGLVLVSIVLVSIPWTVWRVTETVIAPLSSLRLYAARIAEGDTTAQSALGAPLEIRELEDALKQMAMQVRARDESLRTSYADLAEAYSSLERTKATIERLAHVKEDFVAVAAHEIRAPLAMISLHTELLQSGELTSLDEVGLRSVAAISAAASRLSSIAADLTDAALLDRGGVSLRVSGVWLDELVDEAVVDASVMAQPHGIIVRVDGPLPEMLVRGDGLRLRQVLDNLLSNAVKYSPAGAMVTVRASCGGNRATVEVADAGRGVAADRADRLFTLFGRLDHDDARGTPGLGLGLAISARIVEAHGGAIAYRPGLRGRGSVFSFWVPSEGPEAQDSPQPTVPVVKG